MMIKLPLNIKRFLLIMLLSSILSACNYPCVKLDDYDQYDVSDTLGIEADGNYTGSRPTDIEYKAKNFDPSNYGQWYDTGMVAKPNQRLRIEANGTVFICKERMDYSTDPSPNTSAPFFTNPGYQGWETVPNSNYVYKFMKPGENQKDYYVPYSLRLNYQVLQYYFNVKEEKPQFTDINGNKHYFKKGDPIVLQWHNSKVRLCKICVLCNSCDCKPWDDHNICTRGIVGTDMTPRSSRNWYTPNYDFSKEVGVIVGSNCFFNPQTQKKSYCIPGQPEFVPENVEGWLGFQIFDGAGDYGDNTGQINLTAKYLQKNDCFKGKENFPSAGEPGALEFMVINQTELSRRGCCTDLNDPDRKYTIPNNVTGPVYTVDQVDQQNASPGARIFDQQMPHGGKIWMRVRGFSDDYNIADADRSNYQGRYNVQIYTFKTVNTMSNIEKWAVDPVRQKLNIVKNIIYMRFAMNPLFQRTIQTAAALYIMLFAGMFMFGMVRDTQMDFAKRAAKVALVLAVISPTSLSFFSNNFLVAFEQGTDALIHFGTGLDPATSTVFGFVDETVAKMFGSATWKKLAALLFAFPIGAVYFIIIVYCFIKFILAILEALIVYLMCMIGVAFLSSLAPLFFLFLLFDRTKAIFDDWVKHMFFFMIVPVFLFIGLGFLNSLVLLLVQQLTAYTVCWKCVIDLHIKLSDSIIIPMPFCFKFYSPVSALGIPAFLVDTIPPMLGVFLITMIASEYIDFCTRMSARLIGSPIAAQISGAKTAKAISAKISAAAGKVTDFVSKSNK